MRFWPPRKAAYFLNPVRFFRRLRDGRRRSACPALPFGPSGNSVASRACGRTGTVERTRLSTLCGLYFEDATSVFRDACDVAVGAKRSGMSEEDASLLLRDTIEARITTLNAMEAEIIRRVEAIEKRVSPHVAPAADCPIKERVDRMLAASEIPNPVAAAFVLGREYEQDGISPATAEEIIAQVQRLEVEFVDSGAVGFNHGARAQKP